jgi:hypothetical protein
MRELRPVPLTRRALVTAAKQTLPRSLKVHL